MSSVLNMDVFQTVTEHEDVCHVFSSFFIDEEAMRNVRKLLCVSKNFRQSEMLRAILERIQSHSSKNMDAHTLSKVAHIYQCLCLKQQKYQDAYMISLYGIFDMVPININSANQQHISHYYKEVLLSTDIFDVIGNWFNAVLAVEYDTRTPAHVATFACSILCLYRCITATEDAKTFIYNNARFSDVCIRGILKSYGTSTFVENYKVQNYIHALLETLITPENFEVTLRHLYDSLISNLSISIQKHDFNLHYLQNTITRILRRTASVSRNTILEILYNNSYLEIILHIGIKTDISCQHTHFSICAALSDLLYYHDVLFPVENMFLFQYTSKLSQQHPCSVILHGHILQFILKLFRQPKSVTDYDIIANCVFEMCTLSPYVRTGTILTDLQMCTRVVMSRLKTQLTVPAWDSISCMCVIIVPQVIQIASLARKSIFLETIAYASRKVSDAYFLVLLGDLVNIYSYLCMEDVYGNIILTRDTVALLKVPFSRLKVMQKTQFRSYIESTKIPLLLEKIMTQYLLDTAPCQRNTDQMLILVETVFLVFSIDPCFVKKMQLVAFCTRILENNLKNDNVVLSATIQSTLLAIFSEYQHANDANQQQPVIITFLCQTLLSENTKYTFKRRMNLSIFWNICDSEHYADESSCKEILAYCLMILKKLNHTNEYDTDELLLCQKILNNMTQKKLYSEIRNHADDEQIVKALETIRRLIQVNRDIFDTCYLRYLDENTKLLHRLTNI